MTGSTPRPRDDDRRLLTNKAFQEAVEADMKRFVAAFQPVRDALIESARNLAAAWEEAGSAIERQRLEREAETAPIHHSYEDGETE